MFLREPGRISLWIFLNCLLFSLIALLYTRTFVWKTTIWFVSRNSGQLSIDNQDLCFSFQFLIILRRRSAQIPLIPTLILLLGIPIRLFLIETLSLCQTTARIGQQERESSWNRLPHTTLRRTVSQKLPKRQSSEPQEYAKSKEMNACTKFPKFSSSSTLETIQQDNKFHSFHSWDLR